MRLIYTTEFKQDLAAAHKHYHAINIELGRKLRLEAKVGLAAIKQNPYFQVRYKNIHCFSINTFPYMIHYTIEDQLIYILAFINTSKDPNENWVK